jgi:hypothetical protein
MTATAPMAPTTGMANTRRTAWHFAALSNDGTSWHRALGTHFTEDEVVKDILLRLIGADGFPPYNVTVIDTHVIELEESGYRFRWYGPKSEGVS